MTTYRIEKYTTVEWVVTGQRDDEPIRNVIAKCPAEGIALTIKGMYEKEEHQDSERLGE